MANKKSFYDISAWGDNFHPGSSFQLSHAIRYQSDKAAEFLKPLTAKDKKELEQQKKESEAKEKSLYTAMGKLAKEWDEQASQTLLLTRAIEYLETLEVKHTGNEWKKSKDGALEISNLVYKMRFKIEQSETGEIRLEWCMGYNVPEQPKSHWYNYNRYDNPWGADIYIVRPEKRTYTTMAAAQKFIQTRFDEYLPLFSVLSPPVPFERQKMFSVNGYLLPGYTVAPPERTEPDEDRINALLDCLEDGESDAEPPQETLQAPPQEQAPIPEKPLAPPKPVRRNTKKATHKKAKSGLVR